MELEFVRPTQLVVRAASESLQQFGLRGCTRGTVIKVTRIAKNVWWQLVYVYQHVDTTGGSAPSYLISQPDPRLTLEANTNRLLNPSANAQITNLYANRGWPIPNSEASLVYNVGSNLVTGDLYAASLRFEAACAADEPVTYGPDAWDRASHDKDILLDANVLNP